MTKYQEFIQTKEVLENLEPYIISDFDLDRVFQKYKQLLEEVLEQFKLLEDNLEWRKKVEAKEWGNDDTDYFESDEEREEWNELMRQKIEKTKTNQPCHNLVSKILKNNPQAVDELFQLLSDFKFRTEEGIGEKE